MCVMNGLRGVAVAAGVCGLAVSAGAQTVHLDISFDETAITIGETATVTMTVTFEGFGASAYFAVIAADLIQEVPGTLSASPATGLDWANPALGAPSGGTASGANLIGVFGAQSTFLPPVDSSNPFVILQWTVTGVAEGGGRYSVVAAADAPGAIGVVDPTVNPFAAPVYFNAGDPGFVVTSGCIGVGYCVPAPGTVGLALLSLGVSGRRRRDGGLR